MPARRDVLRLCALSLAAAVAGVPSARAQGRTIFDIVAADPDLSTLAGAFTAAGLADALKAPGRMTLFAPTNAAFARLPAGTLESLLQPANKGRLAALLQYHLVPRALTAADLDQRLRPLQSIEGQYIQINGMAGVRVNDARVVRADIAASNGLIHTIDSVLSLPG